MWPHTHRVKYSIENVEMSKVKNIKFQYLALSKQTRPNLMAAGIERERESKADLTTILRY